MFEGNTKFSWKFEIASVYIAFHSIPAETLPGLRVAVGPQGAVLVAVAGLALAREGVPPEAGQAAVALPAGGVAQALWCTEFPIPGFQTIFREFSCLAWSVASCCSSPQAWGTP